MLRSAILGLALSFVSSVAFANSCPSIMAAIDAALPTAQLSDTDLAKVNELRATGESLHQAGDHAGSEKALNEAKAIMGI
ncbi:MAG: hypothetical protein ACRECW_06325 [Phyllobacterium sp.]